MNHDVSQCENMQSHARSINRSGAHHRKRDRVVSLPSNAGEEREQGLELNTATRSVELGHTFTPPHRKESLQTASTRSMVQPSNHKSHFNRLTNRNTFTTKHRSTK